MVLETVQNLNDLSGNEPLAIWQAARFFLEVYAIEKIRERLTVEKKIKTAAKTIPKQFLRRGLDDGTERLRSQFRDASQRGQRSDGYGGDQIEDAAWKGTRWGTRGVELLLKKKNKKYYCRMYLHLWKKIRFLLFRILSGSFTQHIILLRSQLPF